MNIQNLSINQFTKSSIQYQSRLDVISAIYNEWNIKELKQSGICRAWLLNWAPVYFIQHANLIDNILTHKGKEYQLKLLGNIQDINKASKVALSFRECDELGINVCLIKFIYSN